ncbi:MAG TPA: glycosyltransferase [Nitrospiria bacterium]
MVNPIQQGPETPFKIGSENHLELSVVMPCLNEAETVGTCVKKAREFLEKNQIKGEIIVADNGSTDGSQTIAQEEGAKLIHVQARGYGAALKEGINAAQGKYVIMGDADDSYDFSALFPFVQKLREGYELVMGNRFKGGIQPGAMPFLHKYLGNPVLSSLGRLFFKSPAGDFYCGLRGFKKEAVQKLDLQVKGMEYAHEMVVKSTLHHLKITEIPIILSRDGRSRPSHLRTWRDGWRTLRFLLIYSPRWLFFYPGIFMILLGTSVMLWLWPEPRTIGGVTFDIHTMLFASAFIILGLQAVAFALFSKVFAWGTRLIPEDDRITSLLNRITLERGIVLGGILTLTGIAGSIYAVIVWGKTSFGPLVPFSMMRITIPALTALVAGIQIILFSFFLSVLGLIRK